jgi:hypothetical protein
MGIARGPRIVKDGIVFHYDFGSTRCYTSGSSTANDLSDRQSIASVVNSPTIDSDKGALSLGQESYVTGSDFTTLSGSAFTIDIWTKPPSVSNVQTMFNNGGQAIIRSNVRLLFNNSNTNFSFNLYNDNITNATVTNSADTWVNYTCTLNNTFTQSLYENASFVTSRLAGGLCSLQGKVGIGTNFRIAGITTSYSGSIASVICYNRALSEVEIQQNYNALKTRFE